MEHRWTQFRRDVPMVGFGLICFLMVRSFFHFFKHSADDPVLLNVDGNYSNTKNLDLVYKTKEHSIAIISLPPFSTPKYSHLLGHLAYLCSTRG